MPPKTGGGAAGSKKQNQRCDNQARQSTTTTTATSGSQISKNSVAQNSNQLKFNVAHLILEGVKVNKLQLNDLLKQHLNDVKVNDIQLSRSGSFRLYAKDVSSFNRLLNDFTSILTANAHPGAKLVVPRSIHRIKDTQKVAFVKRVDLELPEDRILDALKTVGLDVINVIWLTSKDSKTPTRTIKITFSDVQNRNTFVHTGLQVDSMHFIAEAASQNAKPVQCYICLKYGHIAKYCQIKQQICARCGDNHRIDQCIVASEAAKCCNCKDNHLAISNDCSQYIEQEKRMLNLIHQYSTTSKQVATAPAPYNTTEFPPLPNLFQQHKEILQSSLFDDILNALSSRMETIVQETTNRIFKALQQKIKKLEKSIGIKDTNNDDYDEALTISDSDSSEEEEAQVVKHIKNQQKQNAEKAKLTTTTNDTSAKPTTTTYIITSKQSKKQKQAKKVDKERPFSQQLFKYIDK